MLVQVQTGEQMKLMGWFSNDRDCGAVVQNDDARVGVNRSNRPVAKICTRHESSGKAFAHVEVRTRDVCAKTDRERRCAHDLDTLLVSISDARRCTASGRLSMVSDTESSDKVQTRSGNGDSEGAQHALESIAEFYMNLVVTGKHEQNAVSGHSCPGPCYGEVMVRFTGEYLFGGDRGRSLVRGVTFLGVPGGIWHVGGALWGFRAYIFPGCELGWW